jgi:hypothetical protein
LDTVQTLDFTIDQADEAADLLGVTADQITERLRDVNRVERAGRSAYAVKAALGALVTIAAAHRDDCAHAGCLTCSAIRDAFAANVAGLRTLRLEVLERPGRADNSVD